MEIDKQRELRSPDKFYSAMKSDPEPPQPPKVYSYQKKIVDRKKMSPDEILNLNLKEIFKFYSRQHVKNNVRFDEIGMNSSSINMGEFTCLCRDFGIVLPKPRIVDIFHKAQVNNQDLGE